MPSLAIQYFDIPGGRGEPSRLALHIAGVPFEDKRISFPQWPATSKTLPLKQCPVLEVDGVAITQSNAINRYVGKLTGLYPEDPYQALLCDEIMDAMEDLTTKVVATFSIKETEELRAAREALIAGPIKKYLTFLEQRLESAGGEYFADKRLTMADLKVMMSVRQLVSGVLDHIPKDTVSYIAPTIMAHFQRIMDQPKISTHYAN